MYQNKIEKDKILIVYHNTPATLAGNLLGCLPLAILLWDEHNAMSGGGWLLALYLYTLVRWLHYRTLDPVNDSFRKIKQFAGLQALFVFGAGGLWGAAGIIFFDPDEIKSVAVITLTFVCMAAASLASLSSKPLSFGSFAIPLFVPLIINMLLQEQAFYTWMAFGATIYLLAIFTFSLNLAKVVHDSLKLKYENNDLIVHLKEQTHKANLANTEKSRFLAATSHDLRQPLHAVNLYYEVLNQKLKDPEERQDLENIHRGLTSLNSMLDILFDISRLDAGIVEKHKVTFDIDELLDKLRKQFEMDASAKGIGFNVRRQSQLVYSDPVLLERVLTNLFVNAVRYTDQGKIEVFTLLDNDRGLAIHIKDSGIGIPQENLNEIFNEFYQLNNPERDGQKGLGLGLAIVKRVLNLLGHKIVVRSQVGQGSEFIVFVPISQGLPLVKSNNTEQEPAHRLSLNGIDVLLIENESDIVNAMQTLLTQWGCRFYSAISTEQALTLIKEGFRPDLILSDYRMPGELNGCQLINKIQADVGDIPAIVITGDTGAAVSAEIKQHKLYALHKPLKPAQLRILMARLMQKRSLQGARNKSNGLVNLS